MSRKSGTKSGAELDFKTASLKKLAKDACEGQIQVSERVPALLRLRAGKYVRHVVRAAAKAARAAKKKTINVDHLRVCADEDTEEVMVLGMPKKVILAKAGVVRAAKEAAGGLRLTRDAVGALYAATDAHLRRLCKEACEKMSHAKRKTLRAGDF